jgi:single-stranded DNA-binding protein
MRGLNKVTLIGNLGRDPEVQTISGDIPVARFAIATKMNLTATTKESFIPKRTHPE